MRIIASRFTMLAVVLLALIPGFSASASAAEPYGPGAFQDFASEDPRWTRSCSAPYISNSGWYEVQICISVRTLGHDYRPLILVKQVYEHNSQPWAVNWQIQALNYGSRLFPDQTPDVAANVLCQGEFLPHDYKMCYGPQRTKDRHEQVGAVDPHQVTPVYSPKR